jgi:hypothetical protein
MMRDIDGAATRDIIELNKFRDKLSKGPIWNYFEIKTLIYKSEDDQGFQFFIPYHHSEINKARASS